MGRNTQFKIILVACFVTYIFSFSFKELLSSIETSFTKEDSKHSLNFAQKPEAFIQKIEPVQPKQKVNQLAQMQRSRAKSHQEINDPKLESIHKSIAGLTEVKNSCNTLIAYGEQKMDTDYQQCIQTVSNFNCSYSEEWKYLKSKHKQNITNMQEEIKAKEETITLIKAQVSKKSESKNMLIKEILPEISQIEKDIGQVELILELMGEAFDKTEKSQSFYPQPSPQILVKTKRIIESEKPESSKPEKENKQEIHKKESMKEQQAISKKQLIAKSLSKEKQLEEKEEKELDKAEQELKALLAEEKEEEEQKKQNSEIIDEKEIDNQQQEQENSVNSQQANKVVEASASINTIEQNDNLFSDADQAVENIEEQYDKDNINDLLDDIQDRNLFDDAHIFMQTKMTIKTPELSIFDKSQPEPTPSISKQILQTQLVSDEDKDTLMLIAKEEQSIQNLNFPNFIQRSSLEDLQDSLDVKLIREKIIEQQGKIVPAMKTKLLTLHSQLKVAKAEKENQIKTLEELIQSEYQSYAQKIFQIQVEKHKLVEEIQKKQDWINQLESKITDCENQDLMLSNCENTKEQDISYLKELEEFKAMAEGSLEQLTYLIDYKNIPVVSQNQEVVAPVQKNQEQQPVQKPVQQPQTQKPEAEAAAAQEAAKEAAKQENIDQQKAKEEPKQEAKEEDKTEEAKKEEPKEEAKEQAKKEEAKEEPKEETTKEAPKEKPKEESKEEPKEEPKKEAKKEPKEEAKKEEPKEEAKEEPKEQLLIRRLAKKKHRIKKSQGRHQFSMIQEFDESPFTDDFAENYEIPNFIQFDDEPPILFDKREFEQRNLKKKLKKYKK